MKKLNILTITFILFACNIYSQITLIPDPEFEEYLVLIGIDSDGIINGQVFTSDIDQIMSFTLPGNPQITDLTGIEDFTSLEYFEITSVNITEIDLSENLNLKTLLIADVSLNNLDISNNAMLEQLQISLNFAGGFFTSQITYIDLSSNILLGSVIVTDSYITHFDFINNINLFELRLLHMNDLNYVLLNNGNNQNIVFLRFIDNENLLCVQVDDPLAVIAGSDPPYDNWIIENNPIITDDCSLGIENFLASLIILYPNPVKDSLTIDNNLLLEIKKITVYNILGKIVFTESINFNQLNLSELQSGVLFFKIETESGTITKKIIKE